MSAERMSRESANGPENRQRAFTLLELLVVISIVALLMAILTVAVRKARNQARAVVCQANLRQWGILLHVYTSASEGRLPEWGDVADDPDKHLWWWDSPRSGRSKDSATNKPERDLLFCPSATRPAAPESKGIHAGGTFLAWVYAHTGTPAWGSYGLNDRFQEHPPAAQDPQYVQREIRPPEEIRPALRLINDVPNANRVPILLDSCMPWGDVGAGQRPAKYDAVPTRVAWDINSFCIDRHAGRVGTLFLDWSTRRVGLKELWTLKWHKDYDTAGPWSKAGGVRPEDWPKWMRRFKDY